VSVTKKPITNTSKNSAYKNMLFYFTKITLKTYYYYYATHKVWIYKLLMEELWPELQHAMGIVSTILVPIHKFWHQKTIKYIYSTSFLNEVVKWFCCTYRASGKLRKNLECDFVPRSEKKCDFGPKVRNNGFWPNSS